MSSEYWPRVLSVHVHVVHGYAANKCIVFPLQLLGFEVDPINSAQYATHLGYGNAKGSQRSIEEINHLLEGLELNSMDKYDYFITGYMGRGNSLKEVPRIVQKLKEKNPNLVYVCDPIMGDDGKMYLPEELLPVYRDIVVPLADIVTPNQYEAEWLTGVSVLDVEGAIKAIKVLKDKGVKIVLISSINSADGKSIISVASNEDSCYQIVCPRLEARFSGPGDVLAGLFLAWTHLTGGDMKRVLENCIATIQYIVRDTYDQARAKQPIGELSPANVELRLIQNRKHIEFPGIEINAIEIKI